MSGYTYNNICAHEQPTSDCSFNWTRSAHETNKENVLITSEPAAVRGFSEEFDRLWAEFEGNQVRP